MTGRVRGKRMSQPRLLSQGPPGDDHGQLPGGVAEEIARAVWRKSSISNFNGSCVEIARLRTDRIGVRDTKDQGAGPVLVFTQREWSAFLSGAKAGEFDSI
jgi:Domain of unknown function (DUF397)